METGKKVAIWGVSIIGLSALTLLVIHLINKGKKPKKTVNNVSDTASSNIIKSYQQAEQSGFVGDVLYNVISRQGQSKDYGDIIPLDGGTVGVAHFAVGGLADLYKQMDTMKYFGKTREDMIANYSSKCRPAGKTGDDTGWGCYSKGWWKAGFDKFLASPESKQIQDKAWALKMQTVINNALSKGWNTKRQLAIALGIANSRGAAGFKSMALDNKWDAEKTLQAYIKDDHTKRRAESINQFFPLTNAK